MQLVLAREQSARDERGDPTGIDWVGEIPILSRWDWVRESFPLHGNFREQSRDAWETLVNSFEREQPERLAEHNSEMARNGSDSAEHQYSPSPSSRKSKKLKKLRRASSRQDSEEESSQEVEETLMDLDSSTVLGGSDENQEALGLHC